MEKEKHEFNLKFQECSRDGGYWSGSSWYEVTVYAENYSEALYKAKKITECNYVRAVECKVKEVSN